MNRYPELAALLGPRYTESIFERSFYRRDLAAVPPFLARLLGQTLPDAVARPQDAEEVAGLVRSAVTERLPIVPRAAATTVYWNSVPVRGGLVLDLNGMRAIGDPDEAALTVTVQPGVRWEDLEIALARHGLATRSYPTSAPAATVGGWLSMEGYGIGSLRYGGLAEQVVRLQAVLPNGQIVSAEPGGTYGPAIFAGAEGTLGVITEITLRIRLTPDVQRHTLIACPNVRTVQGVITRLTAAEPLPFTMHFTGAAYGSQMAAAGFTPPDERPVLAVTHEGTAEEIAAGDSLIRQTVEDYGAELLPEALAEHEWDERFMALRLKRAGPTVLGAEFWLPLDQLAGYEADAAHLAAQQRLPLATYGTVVRPGWATVMSLYPCDESRLVDYTLALSLTRQLYKLAFRHGGKPYGIGVWNTPYLHRVGSATVLQARRARKRQLDPLNLMNPGKLYAPPLLLSPAIFGPGMAALALLRRLTRERL